jgi:hypothetical protein
MSTDRKGQWRTARTRVSPARSRRGRTGPAAPRNEPQAGLASQVLDWVVLLVPPTTLFTALAIWFGWAMTDSRNSHFGLDLSTMELTTTDYVMRSPDALIDPAIFLAFAVLVGLGVHALVRRILHSDAEVRTVRIAATGAAVLGFVAVALAVHSLLGDGPGLWRHVDPLLRPALLGGGALCIAYSFFVLIAVTDRPTTRPSSGPTPAWERSVYLTLTALMILSLFWATTLYARAEGLERAEYVAEHLGIQPAVTVYSAESLAIGGSVPVERNTVPDARYRYKYSGLRLLARSGEKFFLLPGDWTRAKGTLLVIRDDPSIRIELRPGTS